jgi:hypothetical protein
MTAPRPQPQAEQTVEPQKPQTANVRALPANLPDPGSAQLPANYEAAKLALLECSRVDECQDWADKMAAMASYARQSEDEELGKMCRRIQARALERCGELLKAIPAASGGHEVTPSRGAPTGGPVGRMQAARDAGLSRDQTVTALRVANVPKEEFERQVESDNPPTVTALAEQGKKSKPLVDLGDIAPEDYQEATRLIGLVDDFVRQAASIDVLKALRGMKPHDLGRLTPKLHEAREWLSNASDHTRDPVSPPPLLVGQYFAAGRHLLLQGNVGRQNPVYPARQAALAEFEGRDRPTWFNFMEMAEAGGQSDALKIFERRLGEQNRAKDEAERAENAALTEALREELEAGGKGAARLWAGRLKVKVADLDEVLRDPLVFRQHSYVVRHYVAGDSEPEPEPVAPIAATEPEPPPDHSRDFDGSDGGPLPVPRKPVCRLPNGCRGYPGCASQGCQAKAVSSSGTVH